MTIVVGLPCKDGLIICADEQLSIPGGHKYTEEKIAEEQYFGSTVVFGYSNDPSLAKEARNKITYALNQLEGPEEDGPTITPQTVYEIADGVFTGMGRIYTQLNLQMLVAVGGVLHVPEMFVFDRTAFYRTDTFVCLGAGESSILRYLKDNLYSDRLTLEQATNLGIYLVSKATDYIDGVGGPIDAIRVTGRFGDWVSTEEIEERKKIMLSHEKSSLEKIINFSLSSTILP